MTAIYDPKYQTGPIVNRATGVPVPDFEPVVIFRAQDPIAREFAIKTYAIACAERGLASAHDGMVERYQAFGRFAEAFPDRMKPHPDTSTSVRHDGVVTGMLAADRPYLYCLSGGNVLQFVRPNASGRLQPGTTTEEVLDVLIDRITTQDAMGPCQENRNTLLHLTAARSAQVRRMARVESAASSDLAAGVVMQFGIQMKPCTSSNVEAFGYDAARQVLAVRFNGGKVYHYADVPSQVHAELAAATSVGQYVARHITAGQYEGARQDEPTTAGA